MSDFALGRVVSWYVYLKRDTTHINKSNKNNDKILQNTEIDKILQRVNIEILTIND